MTYREDESRIQKKELRENFAAIIASLVAPDATSAKASLVMKRRSCGWNERFMLEVITGATL